MPVTSNQTMMAANMYKIGDYVYFEISSSSPYQIRRIEELNKTPNGNVEAKVMCFYRRRDISPTLLSLADSHCQGTATKDLSTSSPSIGGRELLPNTVERERPAAAEVNGSHARPASPSHTNVDGNPDAGPTIGLRGMEDLQDSDKHQLRHRELFLSRQIESLPATHIRGKCAVTLLNEMETPQNYLGKEDAFFYSLVYDPQQKTLLADKGEIRQGEKYQAVIPDVLTEKDRESHRVEPLETLVFRPLHTLTDRQVDQFLIVARAVGTFSRALDGSSSVKQPSLHMSAAAASRDITLLHALSLLHHADYDLGKAMCYLVPPPSRNHYPLEVDKTTGHRTATLGGPVLCRDQLEEWSAAEANLFEESLEKYGKDFNDIRQDFLPWKSLKDIVEYYYMWKTTDRYVHQRRVKAVEAESRLKQVYIPSYNKVNPAAVNPTNPPGQSMASQLPCESCGTEKSTQFYLWGPSLPQTHMCLCQECWAYWKKYGGLKKPHQFETYDKSGSTRADESAGGNGATESVTVVPNATAAFGTGSPSEFRCPECKKVFDRADKLQQHRVTAHPLLRCTVDGCGREYRARVLLTRHLTQDHGILLPSWEQMNTRASSKTRATFYLHTTPLTRIARRLSPKTLLNPRHFARNPFLPINGLVIKQNCQSKPKEDVVRVAEQLAHRSSTQGNTTKRAQPGLGVSVHKTAGVVDAMLDQQAASRVSVVQDGRASSRKRQANGAGNECPPVKRAAYVPNANHAGKTYDGRMLYQRWFEDGAQDLVFKSNLNTRALRKNVRGRFLKKMARSPCKVYSQTARLLSVMTATQPRSSGVPLNSSHSPVAAAIKQPKLAVQ